MAEVNEATPLTTNIEIPEITIENVQDLFGLSLHDVYKAAIKYYRGTVFRYVVFGIVLLMATI